MDYLLIGLLFIIVGLIIVISSTYLFYRWGWKSLGFLIPLAVLLVLFTGKGQNASTALMPLIIGCVGGYTLRFRKGAGQFLLITSTILAVLMVGEVSYLIFIEKLDINALFQSELNHFIANMKVPADQKEQYVQFFDSVKAISIEAFPFSSFFSAVIISSISYLIIKKYAFTFLKEEVIEGLENFQLKEFIIFIFIGGWAAVLLIDKNSYYFLYIIGLNIALIGSLLYFIQALGVIKHLMLNRSIPVSLFPFFIFIIFMLSLMGIGLFFYVMLAGLGTLDLWADFRKLNEIQSVESEK